MSSLLRITLGRLLGRKLLFNINSPVASYKCASILSKNHTIGILSTTNTPVLRRILKRNTIQNSFDQTENMKYQYPEARRDDSVVDSYHGIKIADPYRWLEDPDGEETKKFVDAQNAITQPFLDKCEYRQKINENLTKYWNYPKYSCPARHGNKYYFYKNSGLQNQSVFYVQDSLEGEPKVFLDPNTLSEDGTVALQGKAFSEDDKLLAYGISECGSDWITIHFMNVDTGEKYPEVLNKVKCSSMAWTHDNKGIFYGMYPDQQGKNTGSATETSKNQKLYYHLLGTPQNQDVLVAEFPEEPSIIIKAEVSDCGRWLFLAPAKDCKDNLLYFADLRALPGGKITGKIPLTPIVTKFEADFEYISNDGAVCVLRTNKDAPNYRLITVDLEHPAPANWKTLIPQHATDVLTWACPAALDKLVMCYLRDVKDILQVHELSTGKLISALPLDVGTIAGFSGERKYNEIFYQFTSFLSPGTIYRCDLSKSPFVPKVLREMKVAGFDPSKYETRQVFYNSKDGTKVPMFIVHKKGLVKNGRNPVLLYGYGGFNVSLQPSFSVTRLVLIHHLDGVLAIPNLRGGGEYGERWHDAGRLFNKQNVFDDFHAAAEFLIADGYTGSDRLAIQGGSNGGLLVAACINQRPELYKAAVCQVGVLDMLRFHKFTIGCLWVSDYGSADDEKHFNNLIKFSPLHNIREPPKDIQYPATLLTTADHDDRVVPSHSLKFIAQMHHVLRDSTKQTNPLLIRIETKAGHGSGKPTSKVIEENTDMLCFLQLTLGMQFKD